MQLESIVVTTPPAVEPLTLSEVKAYSRVTISDEDTLITGLITQARQEVERRTRRALATQTIQAVHKREEGETWEEYLELPSPPLQSVSTVEYRSSVWDVWVELETVNFISDSSVDPGRVYLKNIPSSDYLRVTYQAGYNSLDPGLKKILLSLVLYWFDNRDKPLLQSLDQDLRSYKVWLV